MPKKKEEGAPVDFPGRVLPNPKHLKVESDTEHRFRGKPTPTVSGGEPGWVGPYTKSDEPKKDISNATIENPIAPPEIRSFKHGTDYVPHDMFAYLHKGEKVVPKEENHMMDATEAMSKIAPKKPKKEISDMHIKMSHNKKHIVTHKHHHPMHHEDETHVMNNMADLHAHMDKHLGTPNEGEAAPAEAPTPMTPSPSQASSPSPMPGM
jgi:hypothetical protein